MNKRIWTPGGDVPVGDEAASEPRRQEAPSAPPPEQAAPGAGPEAGRQPSEEELRQYIAQLRSVPVQDLVVNSAVSLYQIAAVHLQPDELDDARLAIDALEGLVTAVSDRLGPASAELDQILTQLRLDFVSAQKAAGVEPDEAGESEGGTP